MGGVGVSDNEVTLGMSLPLDLDGFLGRMPHL